MPRRNHPKARRKQRRLDPGQATPRALRTAPPPPVEGMLLPKGRCYHRSKVGKLIFATEADAQAALRQAKHKRKLQTNGHVECRYYPCPEGGCGGFHLTSRKTFEERGMAS